MEERIFPWVVVFKHREECWYDAMLRMTANDAAEWGQLSVPDATRIMEETERRNRLGIAVFARSWQWADPVPNFIPREDHVIGEGLSYEKMGEALERIGFREGDWQDVMEFVEKTVLAAQGPK